MATPIELFDYHLPSENIAQQPTEPRDHCKLLVLDRQTGAIEHKIFYQIIDELRAGDVLVLNDSKVFKARLIGVLGAHSIEVFLLRGQGKIWEALLKPGRRVAVGDKIQIQDLSARVLEKRADGIAVLEFDREHSEVIAFADQHGEVPLPPYIERLGVLPQPTPIFSSGNRRQLGVPRVVSPLVAQYQTVYAREVGSVAAPTAGLHFTPELIEQIRAKGIEIVTIMLHVGLGTFRPVKTATLEEHEMHAEYVEISTEASATIKRAKAEGRRVIAVGTTTVRALEATAAERFVGDVNIFITPGYQFKIVDGLITNFHLPKSTLLALVSALARRENILAAYQEAIANNYRFYSFGDAMFIR